MPELRTRMIADVEGPRRRYGDAHRWGGARHGLASVLARCSLASRSDGKHEPRGMGPPGPPKLGPSDPRVGHRGRVTLLTKSIRISEWVERENRDGGHVCACGFGALIQVERRHHWSGGAALPPRSSSQVTTKEVQAIREEGLLTATAAARELGIGPTTLYQLEGKLFGPAERRGKRRIRIFTPEQVEQIRKKLRSATRLGMAPELLSLQEVARRAGCAASTLRCYLGAELPAGQRLGQPRGGWGFTAQEAEQIATWAKHHVRKRRSRRPSASRDVDRRR